MIVDVPLVEVVPRAGNVARHSIDRLDEAIEALRRSCVEKTPPPLLNRGGDVVDPGGEVRPRRSAELTPYFLFPG